MLLLLYHQHNLIGRLRGGGTHFSCPQGKELALDYPSQTGPLEWLSRIK